VASALTNGTLIFAAQLASEYAELFLSNPLCVEMSGLCPRIDYRPQWGNDGKVPIHLGCHYTTQPVKRQCLLWQAFRRSLSWACPEQSLSWALSKGRRARSKGSGQAHHKRYPRTRQVSTPP